ncbi:DNA repair protein RecO [Marinoscillum sp.]|uniref:DNA repair protein RecO n=1 Tax=Marinoscillum sp. TaxID=2024838 RepID=UPI003BAC92BD
MIEKTRGIVIKYIKYQESSIIVQIFTEDHGLTSFMVNGIRSARSKRSIGYFQPFSLLDLVIYMKSGREIQRLSEYKYLTPTHSIQTDIKKSTIVLFLSEILSKLLYHEKGPQEMLFGFLYTAVREFDSMTAQIENFHLHFLLKILPYLGLGVADGDELIRSMELEMIHEDQQLLNFVSAVISSDFSDDIGGSGQLRFKALELILNYYHHHTDAIGEIKSLKVLHQVFQ